jgi:hypothetical protein
MSFKDSNLSVCTFPTLTVLRISWNIWTFSFLLAYLRAERTGAEIDVRSGKAMFSVCIFLQLHILGIAEQHYGPSGPCCAWWEVGQVLLSEDEPTLYVDSVGGGVPELTGVPVMDCDSITVLALFNAWFNDLSDKRTLRPAGPGMDQSWRDIQ